MFIDLYNRDPQITIILFTSNMSSHKTDWILFELPLPALSCKQSDKYTWRIMCLLSRNIYYSPSVRIIDLVSHTTYVVCVNFINKWRDLQFKVDSERQIFWETFHGNFYLFSEFLRGNRRRNTFRFDVWPGARTLALRLISQHSTY